MSFWNYSFDILSTIFLICFGIGLLTIIGSLILGGGDGDLGGDSGIDLGADSGGAMDGAPDPSGQASASVHGSGLPIWNLNVILAFLIGFGAVGFIVKLAWGGIGPVFTLLLAIGGGIVLAWLVYSLLAKVLIKGQSMYLRAEDFDPVGAEGQISTTIFPGRVGEISIVMKGRYMSWPAKERGGRQINKGEQAVILAVKDKVAVVVTKEQFGSFHEGL